MKTNATGRELRTTDDRTAKDILSEAKSASEEFWDLAEDAQAAASEVGSKAKWLATVMNGPDYPYKPRDIANVEEALKGILAEIPKADAAVRVALRKAQAAQADVKRGEEAERQAVLRYRQGYSK